jgi:FkbM family methyltransferase
MTNLNILDVQHASTLYAQSFCEQFISNHTRPKFLFGRNQYSSSISRLVSVDGFIDDFTTEPYFQDRPILQLERLPHNALVVNCVPVGRPLTAQRRINAFGYDQLDYYAFARHSGISVEPIEYWKGFSDHFISHQARYTKLQKIFTDHASREILSRIVNFRLSYDLDFMRPFSDTQSRQYFENFLTYGGQEVFADIGAFDGITSEEFSRRCPNHKAIHVYEPNADNLKTAKERLAGNARVHFEAVAIGDRRGVVSLDCSGSSSCIGGAGGVKVAMEPLDAYLETPFTFLKMDVEGAERAVIAGAEKVILRHHPKMAISVYHRPADLVDIPEQVLAIRDDYDIRLRHYTEGFTETVMYFTPRL